MRYCLLLSCLLLPSLAAANPPSASYIFPAGGQRGTKVNVRVGGLFLHDKCGFEMLGPGVSFPKQLTRTRTLWFEGPMLPIPDSQRQEDYPKDMAGTIAIAPDAALGVRYWRLWTSQGATPALKFMVGDLPEIIENEIDGEPIAVPVKLPLTINGRIFPRENIDIYSFSARKGQPVRCEVHATRLGSPLDARLEVRDSHGRRLAEASAPFGGDPVLKFTAPTDGEYHVRIHDINMQGGQAHVYRLTITTEPVVEAIFPLGGRRGTKPFFEIEAPRIPRELRIAIPNDAGAELRLPINIRSVPLLDIDDLPEFTSLGQPITPPCILNGRIASAGQIDQWTIQAKKGETWELELRAAKLGSRLDGVVAITDHAGKTLTKGEANLGDPVLRFTAAADGEFRVYVQDRFRTRGGLDFGYRLRIAPPPAPDFRLTLIGDPRQQIGPDAITVPRRGQAKLKINVERIGGFKDAISLEVRGLPEHVTFTPATINANQGSIDVLFKADEKAKITTAHVSIVGKAKALERIAKVQSPRGDPELSELLLAVALPTPFVIKGEYDMGFAARGGMHKRKYKILRNGYDGPIEISLADKQARHLQGVEGPTFTVPAGVDEFTYSAYLPPWMETGRTCRVCVQGVGVIKEPDGSEHKISFSSVNQNEQLVAVVGPGKLAMEIDKTSFIAIPGKSFAIPVRIKRGQNVEGPVELTLVMPAHLRGLTPMKTTIAAKAEQGELVVQCDGALAGPFNMPLVVRATLMRNGEPLVAEVKVDVQP